MKTLKLVPFFLIAFLCGNFIGIAQEEEEEEIIEEVEETNQDEVLTIVGVFGGIEEGDYIFSYTDEENEESTINFQKITPEATAIHDLKKKEMIGKTFTVMYSSVNEEEKGEDGEIDYTNVKTILMLK